MPGRLGGHLISDYRVRLAGDMTAFEAVFQLQAEIWGSPATGTPANLLRAISSAGGIVLLAEVSGRPVGFAYGFTGRTPQGVLYHRSHAAGVLTEMRGSGVGRALKLAQRRQALGRGLDRMVWTFDPSQTANAHFNLRRLGAVARSFRRDYYGDERDGINLEGPTDRLLVEWFLDPLRNARLAPLRRRPKEAVEVPAPPGDGPSRALRLRLRRDLESAFAEGLAAVDYDAARRRYLFAELPESFPSPAE